MRSLLVALVASLTVVGAGLAAGPPPAPPRPPYPVHAPGRPRDPRAPRADRGRLRVTRPGGVLAVMALLATATAGLAGGALVVGGAAFVARARTVRRRRAAERALRDALPDVVDLLSLCTSAGLTLPLAHERLALVAPAAVRPALAQAARACACGAPRADALVAALGPLGERCAALAHVLADHLRHGVPLAPALDTLSLELRLERRRRAEVDARRVPVRLLAPLITCTLPAFALLTVVPLVAGALANLPR